MSIELSSSVHVRPPPPSSPPPPPPQRRNETKRKRALCRVRDGTLVSSSSPPIVVVGPCGDYHIGFNSNVCEPPEYQTATANSRDTILPHGEVSTTNGNIAAAATIRTLRSATLKSINTLSSARGGLGTSRARDDPGGMRRLRSGHLLFTRPEYYVTENDVKFCKFFTICNRREQLFYYLVALFHVILVTIHLSHGSGPATLPSNIDLEINSHNLATVPVMSSSMEFFNVTSIILTIFGSVVIGVQSVYLLNVYIAAASIHLVLAMAQCPVFSLGVRLIPCVVLIMFALDNREKLSYNMIPLDQ